MEIGEHGTGKIVQRVPVKIVIDNPPTDVAAQAVFLERGLAGASMEEIADRARAGK